MQDPVLPDETDREPNDRNRPGRRSGRDSSRQAAQGGIHYRRGAEPHVEWDATQLYLSEIGHKPLLTAEQEVEYARAALQGEEYGRRRMIEGNLRLVVRIASRYRWYGMAFCDLIEEGNLGLLHAVEKFDPERGFRFSTYASWWIRHSIEHGLMFQCRTIRLPVQICKELNAYRKFERELTTRNGRPPSVEEIAELAGKSVARVRRLLVLDKKVFSTDAPTPSWPDLSLLETLADRTEPTPEARCSHERLHKRLLQWLHELTPRQRAVLLRRFGLQGHDCEILEHVGDEVGLTRERTRQVQHEALRKLRRILARDGLAADILHEYA